MATTRWPIPIATTIPISTMAVPHTRAMRLTATIAAMVITRSGRGQSAAAAPISLGTSSADIAALRAGAIGSAHRATKPARYNEP